MKNYSKTALAGIVGLFFSFQGISQEISVSDPAFAQCVQNTMRENGWQEPEQVASLKCHNMDIKEINSVSQFTQLEQLSVYGNQIESLPDSLPAKLVILNLANNQLKQVHISNLNALTKIYLFKNNLERLELKNLAHLVELKANGNQLTQVLFEQVPELQKIYLFDNQLEIMPLLPLVKVNYLDVRHNPMPDAFYDELDKMDGVTVLHDGNADDW